MDLNIPFLKPGIRVVNGNEHVKPEKAKSTL